MENFCNFQNQHNRFVKDNLETTYRLLQILSKIYKNEFFCKKLVLKGSSAVEFYLQDLKRLFFDIDFDFQVDDMENIQQEREKLQSVLFKIMESLNYEQSYSKSRHSYSLDSFQFSYQNQARNLNYAKIEVNYSFKEHLYPLKNMSWKGYTDSEILLLNLEELLGMKLKALFERASVKDLFDIYQIINTISNFNVERVRKSYLFYFTIASRQEPSNYQKIQEITKKDMIKQLYPLLPKNSGYDLAKIKKEVTEFSQDILNFSQEELEFYRVFQRAEYHPELLFQDKDVIERALNNPLVEFKLEIKKKYQ